MSSHYKLHLSEDLKPKGLQDVMGTSLGGFPKVCNTSLDRMWTSGERLNTLVLTAAVTEFVLLKIITFQKARAAVMRS